MFSNPERCCEPPLNTCLIRSPRRGTSDFVMSLGCWTAPIGSRPDQDASSGCAGMDATIHPVRHVTSGDPEHRERDGAPAGSLRPVFERFTDRGRRVLVLAQEQARFLGHDYIGTEHILLGLMHEEDGIAARALMELGVSLEAVRDRIEETVGRTAGEPTGNPPFTPRAKKVLELSLREALQLGHSYIGTEHLLLGILREGEGVGARVLEGLGFDLPRVRQSVVQVMSGYEGRAMGGVQSASFDPSDSPRCAGCSAELELVLRYRTITVPPTSPNPFPLKGNVVFCNRCGKVVAMLRAESTG